MWMRKAPSPCPRTDRRRRRSDDAGRKPNGVESCGSSARHACAGPTPDDPRRPSVRIPASRPARRMTQWLFDPILLGGILSLAAIAGDTLNYWIGQAAGPKVFRQERSRLFKRGHLERTRRFFERYGSLTIVLARFVPIVRTFAPFVAGIGRMAYGRFLFYNVLGGIVWVTAFGALGYFFGNLPAVREHFTLAIGVVIVLSGVPILVELWRHRRR